MTLPGQIDLNDLTVFAAVVDAGGFARAAARLGVAPAKVSVEVARLETRLGVTLFTRTTRRVAPTEAGQALYEACAPLLAQLHTAIDNVDAAAATLTGNLRVTAPTELGAQSVAPALARFAALHPALGIDLRTGDRIADLVGEGIDVAIRMGWLRDSSLRAVKLGQFAQYAVAAPAYLERAGAPQTPQELATRDWVALTLLPAPLKWTFTSADGTASTVQLRARLRTDSAGSLRGLVRNAAGITVMDQYSAEADLRSGALVRVLPDWTLPTGGTWAVFPPGRHASRKAHAFVAFYQAWLQQDVAAKMGSVPIF